MPPSRPSPRQLSHPLNWLDSLLNAGDYRSTGAARYLRFDEDNCHAQSRHDNQYLTDNAADYWLGLIGWSGLGAVKALKTANRVRKWRRKERTGIKDTCPFKLQELKVVQP